MIIREHQKKTMALPYKLNTIMELSGSTVMVGTLNEAEGHAVFIQTDENPEPVFMSVVETRLLIAGLNAAISED